MGINAGTIQKLYIAYFNRPADVAGLQYWEGQLDANKITMVQLAQSFSVQVEYKNTYGGRTTSDVVDTLYKNLFGRSAESDGLKYWTGQLDSGAVTMGTAALAITNGAADGSTDARTIVNKLSFAAGFTASLDNPVKAAAYNSPFAFEVMRGMLSTVTADGALPSLTPSTPIFVQASVNGINAEEKAAGVDVLVSLAGMQAAAGYQLELMNGDASFASPITHVLSLDEVAAHAAVIHIPGNANWGTDGSKLLGVRASDLFGNTGKVGGQLAVQLDTTPPSLPATDLLTTAFYYNAGHQLDYLLSSIQFSILPGQNSGGHAILQAGGATIASDDLILATDSTLDFSLDSIYGKSAYNSYFTDHNLSVTIFDAAGNSVRSNLSDFQIYPSYTYKPATAPTSIRLTPVGGTVVANTINSSNTNLLVQANINGLEVFGKRAILKIDDREIAYDEQILSTDTTVNFDLGAHSNAELQTLIKSGGVVSVTVIDMNGHAVTSSGNPNLILDYTAGNPTGGSASPYPSVLPVSSLLFNTTSTTQSMQTRSYDSEYVQAHLGVAALPAAARSAVLQIEGVTVATDALISSGDTVLDFVFAPRPYYSFASKFTVSILDAAGQVLSSSVDLRTAPQTYSHVGPAAASNFVVTAVGGEVVAGKFNAGNTGLEVHADIIPNQLSGGRVELHFDGRPLPLAVDSTIAAGDSSISFDLSNLGAGSLQNLIDRNGNFQIWLIDASGKLTQTESIKFSPDYLPPSAPTSINIEPSASIGGGQTVTLSVTAGQANGGKAVLIIDGNAIATDNAIAAGDGAVSFELDANAGSNLLSAIAAGRAQLKLYDAAGNATSQNLKSLHLTTNVWSAGGDHTPPAAAAFNPYTVIAPNGFGFYSGDKAILKFSEATSKLASLANMIVTDNLSGKMVTPYFGSGATGMWNGNGDEFTVTLGSDSRVSFIFDTITLTGVQDLAGNAADISFHM